VELGDVVPEIVVTLITEEGEFGLIHTQDTAIRADSVQPYRGMIEKIAQLLLAAAQSVFEDLAFRNPGFQGVRLPLPLRDGTQVRIGTG
jgi:hypothetical protein